MTRHWSGAPPATKIAYLQLGLAVVLFGLTWPVIKIGLSAATPVWLAAGRASLSAISAFVLLAALRRLHWPARADWPIVLSVGAFQLSFFFALSNLGVQSVPPGRSGVLAERPILMIGQASPNSTTVAPSCSHATRGGGTLSVSAIA